MEALTQLVAYHGPFPLLRSLSLSIRVAADIPWHQLTMLKITVHSAAPGIGYCSGRRGQPPPTPSCIPPPPSSSSNSGSISPTGYRSSSPSSNPSTSSHSSPPCVSRSIPQLRRSTPFSTRCAHAGNQLLVGRRWNYSPYLSNREDLILNPDDGLHIRIESGAVLVNR
ncbi:hypothetical protein DFH09DRAFT_1135264 [Mycena vulgaris]|nr:hypothetical protein DFH09DRAFT_1135264 [Mycena vulgaris]